MDAESDCASPNVRDVQLCQFDTTEGRRATLLLQLLNRVCSQMWLNFAA